MPHKTTAFLIGIISIMGHRTKPCARLNIGQASGVVVPIGYITTFLMFLGLFDYSKKGVK